MNGNQPVVQFYIQSTRLIFNHSETTRAFVTVIRGGGWQKFANPFSFDAVNQLDVSVFRCILLVVSREDPSTRTSATDLSRLHSGKNSN